MYRNYDGKKSAFGDTSVRCEAPDPDTLAAFASQQGRAGALKIMLLNKRLHEAVPVTVALARFTPGKTAMAYRLTAANRIERLPDVAVKGAAISLTLPAQSITLLISAPAKNR